jgi:hypothetical protein
VAGRSGDPCPDFAVCSKTHAWRTLKSVSENNPLVRFFLGLLAVAVVIRVIWWLIAPVVPALIVVGCLLGALRIYLWWRSRW